MRIENLDPENRVIFVPDSKAAERIRFEIESYFPENLKLGASFMNRWDWINSLGLIHRSLVSKRRSPARNCSGLRPP